ncbi:MAG: YaiI/YqxD family protein [Planctomycetes bacterium]|nr:YaiI/YqxD family protein [Planctomycetota bacterium]
MLHIYIDADGCPVKQEVYKVAKRYDLKVTVVANAWMRMPENSRVDFVLVDDQFDAADNWIVEHAEENDIVITADIPLAARCLEKEARALSPRGRIFKEESIGDALANRDVQAYLRETGVMTGGPAPLEKKDRSRFLQRLDEVIQAVRRGKK